VQVGQAVVGAATARGRALRNPHAYGVLEAQALGQRAFRLDVSLDFPQVPCLSSEGHRTGTSWVQCMVRAAAVVSPVTRCCAVSAMTRPHTR